MALGGGNFISQNKILPGTYMNFASVANASSDISDRGIATIPFEFDWGLQGAVMEVAAKDVQKDCLKLFGREYTDPKMAVIRDLFKNVRLAYIVRLGTGGTAASNIHATAKYKGVRGNDLKVVVNQNVDNASKFDVSLYLDTTLVDRQTVGSATDLVDGDFVVWKKSATLAETAGLPLTGGVSETIQNSAYQSYFNLIEGYQFNAIGCPLMSSVVVDWFIAFTKRMRDEHGAKFQCVVLNQAADYEGVVNLEFSGGGGSVDPLSVLCWVTGAIAGAGINESLTNKVYDGEYEIRANRTQAGLEMAIQEGEFVFHRVGSDIRVLADINSLVTVTPEKGEAFKQNQTIRVIDQIANDIAVIFNTKYLGRVPNDEDGRIGLWSDIVQHHKQLQDIRAIEDFDSEDVQVYQGDTKQSVLVTEAITVTNAMEQLYMTVSVE